MGVMGALQKAEGCFPTFPPFLSSASTQLSPGVIAFPTASSQTQPEHHVWPVRRIQYVPMWAVHLVDRINEFLSVQNKSGSVNGVVLTTEVIHRAVSTLASIMNNGILTPHISLNDDGFLHFEWENEGYFLTLTMTDGFRSEFFFENLESGSIEDGVVHDLRVLPRYLSNFPAEE